MRSKTGIPKRPERKGSGFFLASLCETDSPDTGEVALAPEGERWPVGPEGENLATARNVSDCR